MAKLLETKNTSQLVKEKLQTDLYLLEILKDGLVNVSALARNLLPQIKQENSKATEESISIAIKRFVETDKKATVSQKLRQLIGVTQLSMKNDIVHMTFKRNQFMSNHISKVGAKIAWDHDEVFLINQGQGEITIIIDKKNKTLLDPCKEYLVEYTKDLGLISLKEAFQQEGLETPGLYAYFLNQISRKGINLIEIVSTLSQLSLIVREKELIRTYEVLSQNIRFFRKK